MQTAIRIRRRVDSLFNLIKEINSIVLRVNGLKCRGAKRISLDLEGYVTKLLPYKANMIDDINHLFGKGYLDATYASVLDDERCRKSQKFPLADVTNTYHSSLSRSAILSLRKKAKRVTSNT